MYNSNAWIREIYINGKGVNPFNRCDKRSPKREARNEYSRKRREKLKGKILFRGMPNLYADKAFFEYIELEKKREHDPLYKFLEKDFMRTIRKSR